MKMKKILISLFGMALCFSAQAVNTGTWTNDSSTASKKVWINTASWAGGVIPNGVGDIAYLTNNCTSDSKGIVVITNTTPVTIGQLYIGSGDGAFVHKIDSGGATPGQLIFANTGTNAATLTQISTSKGDTIQNVSVLLNSDLIVTNASTSNILTISSVISGTKSLRLNAGTLSLSGANSYSGGDVVNGGTLVINGANSVTGGHTINGGVLKITGNSSAVLANSGDITFGANGGELSLSNTAAKTFANNMTVNGNAIITADVTTPVAGATYNFGTLNMGAQQLTVNVGSGFTSGSAGVKFTGATTLSGGQSTFVVNNGATSAGLLYLTNTVSGAGGITKSGAGTLQLFGGGNSSYSGGTIINNGTVITSSTNSLGTGTLAINNAGKLQMSTSLSLVTNVTVGSSGIIDTGTGGNNLNISGNSTIDGVINGDGNLYVLNNAILTLNGSNNASGANTVGGGSKLIIGSSGKLGTGNLQVYGTSTLDLGGTTQTISDFFQLTSAGSVVTNGTLNASGYSGMKYGIVYANLAGNTAALNKISDNEAALKLFGANSYGGGTTLNDGYILTSNQTALGTGNVVIYNSTNSSTPNKLVLASALTVQGALSSAYRVGNGTSTNFTGIDLGGKTLTLSQTNDSTFGYAIIGSSGSSLVKDGVGKLTLIGTNSYLGTTTVSAGTLVINGDNSAATGNVTIDAAATLMGSGIIGGATTVNGQLKPGNSPGTLEFNAGLTLGSGSTTTLEIVDLSTFDVIKGNGANILTMNSGAAIIFDFKDQVIADGSSYAVFQNWQSIANNGVIFSAIGTNGLTAGQSLDLSALASGGTVTVIPEPATIGMLGLGALVTLLIRRMGARY